MGGKVIEKMRKQHGIHWVGVKFYNSMPDKYILDKYYDESRFRFCEAVGRAIIHPIILEKNNLNCESAKFIFKWSDKTKDDVLDLCCNKKDIEYNVTKNMINRLDSLKDIPKYIGLNTDKDPDVAIAYLNPKMAMKIVRMYNDKTGQELEVFISSMMAICGSLAVKSYITGKITLSFGCDDSREYGGIDKDSLGVCLPKNLFGLFVKENVSAEAVVKGS